MISHAKLSMSSKTDDHSPLVWNSNGQFGNSMTYFYDIQYFPISMTGSALLNNIDTTPPYTKLIHTCLLKCTHIFQ